MRKILARIKSYIPSGVWNLFRKIYFFFVDILENIGPSIKTVNYCGFKLYYNKNNSVIKRLKDEPVFEKEMCEAIERDLGGNFLDIGANIGLISIYIKSKLPNAKIYAFEPGDVQRKLFETTIKENNLKNVTVYKEALGESVGVAKFNVHKPKYAALDGFNDTKRRGKTRVVEVPVNTLDSWWKSAGMPKISVVKIDTEGSELLVLRGAKEFINKIKPIIYLEIEPKNLFAYSYSEKDIKDFFAGIGYKLEEITKDTYRATSLNP